MWKKVNKIIFSQIALFALVAAAAAEAQFGLPAAAGLGYGAYPYAGAGLPYAGAAGLPYAAAPVAPKMEEPTGFYYHVQTYDKTPDYTYAPYNYNNWAGAYHYNYGCGACAYWNGAAAEYNR